MANEVRELSTIFSFKADTKAVDRFSGAISSLKIGIAGISFGKLIKEMTSFGMETDKIGRSLNLMLGGTARKSAEDFISTLRRETSSFNDILGAYTQSIERLGDKEFTELTLQASIDYSGIKGEPVEDIRALFDEFGATGDFRKLIAIGLSKEMEAWAMNMANLKHSQQEAKKLLIERLKATEGFRQKRLSEARQDLDFQVSRFVSVYENGLTKLGKKTNEVLVKPLSDLSLFWEQAQEAGIPAALEAEREREFNKEELRRRREGLPTQGEEERARKKSLSFTQTRPLYESSQSEGQSIRKAFTDLFSSNKTPKIEQTNNITINGNGERKTVERALESSNTKLAESMPKTSSPGG